MTPDGGVAIHLDAPQRLVYSSADGVLCAEPTPDALQAYAASLGVGVGAPSQGAASIAQAMQTGAASVGLHTQSITLMRDALYRVCEQAHNKSIGSADIIHLLQRSQDLTLGVLAIEQLTGAVTSKQVVLSGTANASASSNIANTEAAKAAAAKTELVRKQERDNAQKKVTDDQSAFDALKAQMAAPGISEPETAALQAKKDALGNTITQDKDALTVAEKNYQSAQDATLAINGQLDSAMTSAATGATGNGAFASGSDQKIIDKETAAAIAQAVEQIVDTVVNRGRLVDVCANFMSSAATGGHSSADFHAVNYLRQECTKVFQTYLAAWNRSTTPAAAPGPSPPLQPAQGSRAASPASQPPAPMPSVRTPKG